MPETVRADHSKGQPRILDHDSGHTRRGLLANDGHRAAFDRRTDILVPIGLKATDGNK